MSLCNQRSIQKTLTGIITLDAGVHTVNRAPGRVLRFACATGPGHIHIKNVRMSNVQPAWLRFCPPANITKRWRAKIVDNPHHPVHAIDSVRLSHGHVTGSAANHV